MCPDWAHRCPRKHLSVHYSNKFEERTSNRPLERLGHGLGQRRSGLCRNGGGVRDGRREQGGLVQHLGAVPQIRRAQATIGVVLRSLRHELPHYA